jgi:hypothetical protein
MLRVPSKAGAATRWTSFVLRDQRKGAADKLMTITGLLIVPVADVVFDPCSSWARTTRLT